MRMWLMILWTVMAVFGISLVYISCKLQQLFQPNILMGKMKLFLLSFLISVGLTGVITLCLDFVNAIVCIMYLAMIWALTDGIFWIIGKIIQYPIPHGYVAGTALSLTLIALIIGWYQAHHVWQKSYTLTTPKLTSPLKIALIADAHIGTTFNEVEFSYHLQRIQAQNPDLLVIVGDFVDDNTTRETMIQASRALGQLQLKYGVYFVFGNHDKGYYGIEKRGFSADDLVHVLTQNGVRVLRDEAVLLDNRFYLIGRKDFSEIKERSGHRQSMTELVAGLDTDKYMIVLDHQPADYENQIKSRVALVLSGHTHGGQLRPFNQVGKWIKANNFIYGHAKQGQTDFIVTSGISAWAIKFKTGTKSEYVLIDIHQALKD